MEAAFGVTPKNLLANLELWSMIGEHKGEQIMSILEKLIAVVQLNQKAGEGMSSDFYHFGPQFGIKCYFTKKVRDKAFQRQKLVASLGMAPACYLPFETERDESGYDENMKRIKVREKVFCYVTRKVRVLDSLNRLETPIIKVQKLEFSNFRNAIKEMWFQLQKCGYRQDDNHFGNYGIDSDLQLQLIDFS